MVTGEGLSLALTLLLEHRLQAVFLCEAVSDPPHAIRLFVAGNPLPDYLNMTSLAVRHDDSRYFVAFHGSSPRLAGEGLPLALVYSETFERPCRRFLGRRFLGCRFLGGFLFRHKQEMPFGLSTRKLDDQSDVEFATLILRFGLLN